MVGYGQNPVKIRSKNVNFQFLFPTTLVSNRSTSGQNPFKNCLLSKTNYLTSPHLTQNNQKISQNNPTTIKNNPKQPNNNRKPLKTSRKEKERESPQGGTPLGGARGAPSLSLSLVLMFLKVFSCCWVVVGCFLLLLGCFVAFSGCLGILTGIPFWWFSASSGDCLNHKSPFVF